MVLVLLMIVKEVGVCATGADCAIYARGTGANGGNASV